MDQIEFIEKLKKYGIEQNFNLYKESLQSPTDPEDKNSEGGKLKELFKSLSAEQQAYFLKSLGMVIEDSVAIILALLDGSSNIGQVGGKFQLYYDKDGERYHINNKEGDDLMTLLYDEADEDE
ncbi:hypothetical protein [Hymenobacter terrenus]|uniref:hypothetical protein n=1 Tax=Hymenobacter terrenus TaxID=1629124 RepID=UPI000619C033|nr:hypothetical protein [Hymenobacter terrenus]